MRKILLFIVIAHLLPAGTLAGTLTPSPFQSPAEAEALMEQEDFEQALQVWKALRTNAEQRGAWEDYLNYGLQEGVCLHGMKAYAPAAEHLEDIRSKVEEQVAPDFPELLELYHKLGVSYHYMHEFSKAVDYYLRAVRQREKRPDVYREELVKGFFNVGYVYYAIGDYQRALDHLHRSIEFQPTPPTKELYTTYRILGRTYRELGDFDQSKFYHDRIYQYYLSRYGAQSAQLATHLVDLARLFNEFEKPKQALHYAQAAVNRYKDFPELSKKGAASLANALGNKGDALRKLEDYEQSLTAYGEALEIIREVYGEEHRATAACYNNLGMAYLKMGHLEKAEETLNRALSIKRELDNSSYLGSTLSNYGDLFMEKGAYEEAARYYHEAVCYSSPFCDNQDFRYALTKEEVVSGDLQWIVTSLAGKGKALHALGGASGSLDDWKLAFATFQLTGTLIDRIRLSYQSDHSKGFLTGKTKPIYEDAIRLCLDLYQRTGESQYYEAALGYSEKSKSIILLEAVLKSDERLFTSVDAALRAREQQMKMERGALERQLLLAKEESDTDETIRLTQALLEHSLRYQNLLDSIRQSAPSYYSLLHDVGTASLRDIQSGILSPEQAMIEYFAGDTSLYVFIIKKGSYFVKTLPLDFPLAEWIRDFREGIYARYNLASAPTAQQMERRQRQYAEKGYQLYRKLVGPLEKAGLPEQLIVVPDGVLGYLPFEALLRSRVQQTGAYLNYPFLIKDHQIHYAYSATILQQMDKRDRQSGSDRLLAVAPSFGDGQLIAENRSWLGPLAYNNWEVDEILKIFDGLPLKGPKASKQRFLELVSSYPIIHISSHARASDRSPNTESYIAFTHSGAKLDSSEVLYLWELYNLQIHADLVVLSACETGLGQMLEGEGILSLARAFSYAGAESVVTTLWQVNDHLSAELMVAFYEELKANRSKSEALAAAKRSFLNDARKADPYYWAGFVGIGQLAPESSNNWVPAWAVILLVAASLLAGLFLWRAKRRA